MRGSGSWNEIDRSREGEGSLTGDKQEPKSGTGTLAGPGRLSSRAIKRLFSDVKNALTRKDQATVATRRKRREETGGAFRKLMHLIVCSGDRYRYVGPFLAHTRDWFHLWHHGEAPVEDVQTGPTDDHLYPNL